MFHQILIVGNLGKDPEMRYTPAGQAVTNFNIATNRKWTDQKTGQLVKETTWFKVSVWGKQAENCAQYLKKGSSALVIGRMVPDATTGGPKIWTRQDGTAGAAFEVSAETVRFLSGKDAETMAESMAAPEASPTTEESSIPF